METRTQKLATPSPWIDIRRTLRDKLAFGNRIFVTVGRKSNLAWVSEEQAEVTP
jgi:hypothetical protein